MNGYQLLANAVVEQAAYDYRRALVAQHNGDVKKRLKATKEIRELKRFFLGSHIKLYTKLDGRKLMEAIKAEVIEFNYDLKALEDSHKSAN